MYEVIQQAPAQGRTRVWIHSKSNSNSTSNSNSNRSSYLESNTSNGMRETGSGSNKSNRPDGGGFAFPLPRASSPASPRSNRSTSSGVETANEGLIGQQQLPHYEAAASPKSALPLPSNRHSQDLPCGHIGSESVNSNRHPHGLPNGGPSSKIRQQLGVGSDLLWQQECRGASEMQTRAQVPRSESLDLWLWENDRLPRVSGGGDSSLPLAAGKSLTSAGCFSQDEDTPSALGERTRAERSGSWPRATGATAHAAGSRLPPPPPDAPDAPGGDNEVPTLLLLNARMQGLLSPEWESPKGLNSTPRDGVGWACSAGPAPGPGHSRPCCGIRSSDGTKTARQTLEEITQLERSGKVFRGGGIPRCGGEEFKRLKSGRLGDLFHVDEDDDLLDIDLETGAVVDFQC